MSNPQPNQEDAELREKLMHVFSQHRLVERGRTVSPSDMDAFVDLFHAELEGRQPLFTTNPCGYCGAPVAPVITVTRKEYCNHSHRTLAYNVRKAQLSKDTKEQPHV